jgi:hypothetical protein
MNTDGDEERKKEGAKDKGGTLTQRTRREAEVAEKTEAKAKATAKAEANAEAKSRA